MCIFCPIFSCFVSILCSHRNLLFKKSPEINENWAFLCVSPNSKQKKKAVFMYSWATFFAQPVGEWHPHHCCLMVTFPWGSPGAAFGSCSYLHCFWWGIQILEANLTSREPIQFKGLTCDGNFQTGCLWIDLVHSEMQKHNRS